MLWQGLPLIAYWSGPVAADQSLGFRGNREANVSGMMTLLDCKWGRMFKRGSKAAS